MHNLVYVSTYSNTFRLIQFHLDRLSDISNSAYSILAICLNTSTAYPDITSLIIVIVFQGVRKKVVSLETALNALDMTNK